VKQSQDTEVCDESALTDQNESQQTNHNLSQFHPASNIQPNIGVDKRMRSDDTFIDCDMAAAFLFDLIQDKGKPQEDLKASIFKMMDATHVDGLKMIANFRNSGALESVNNLSTSFLASLCDTDPKEHARMITTHFVDNIKTKAKVQSAARASSSPNPKSGYRIPKVSPAPRPPSRKARAIQVSSSDESEDSDGTDDSPMRPNPAHNPFAGLGPKVQSNTDSSVRSASDDDDLPLSQQELTDWSKVATMWAGPDSEKWAYAANISREEQDRIKLNTAKNWAKIYNQPRLVIKDFSLAPTCKLILKGQRNEKYGHDDTMQLVINYAYNSSNPGNSLRPNLHCKKNKPKPPGVHKCYMWLDALLKRYENELSNEDFKTLALEWKQVIIYHLEHVAYLELLTSPSLRKTMIMKDKIDSTKKRKVKKDKKHHKKPRA
jgi:hypothetical protein